LQKISKIEMDFLISSGTLELNKQGNFGDQLVVVNKQGSGKEKTRFVNDHVYSKLQFLKSKEKINSETIKHNQMYLVM